VQVPVVDVPVEVPTISVPPIVTDDPGTTSTSLVPQLLHGVRGLVNSLLSA
jgi:hypothetical protein